MTVVSNGQFWMYTVALLILWIIVLTTAFNNESNVKNKVSLPVDNAENEFKNTGICKSLCKRCGCLGFYCGEECICECNNDHAGTECIREIQISAQNFNVPFEVLIQGPTANNFVRSILQFDQKREQKLYGHRNKRSTVTVYKPTQGNQTLKKATVERKTSIKYKTSKLKNRYKRSSNNQDFDWFSDITNNLLQPAPLGGHKRKTEEPKNQPAAPKGTAYPSIFDSSWIFDNTRNILTPRPLSKIKNPKIMNNFNNENGEVSTIEIINSQNMDKFNDEFGGLNTDYSDEVKNIKIKEQQSFLQEQNVRKVPQDNLLGSLYSRLFKNDFSTFDDNYSFLPENNQKLQNPSLKDESNNVEDLFLEEEEVEKKSNRGLVSRFLDDNSSKSEVSSAENVTKGLHRLRMPWFKPGKLLEKFRRVMNS